MTTLSIVIPAYNEEDCIEEIMERTIAVRDALAKVNVSEAELIVVNDGSSDRTAEIANSIAAKYEKVNIINHPTNLGYGAALKTGFSNANSELIGFLDADGTYPPEYFPKLVEFSLDGYEIVVGSRMAGADTEMPTVRKLGNTFFAKFISMIGQHRISDSASGMRVFHREILPKIYPLPDGLNLTPIMSTRAIYENIRMIETPIPYQERVGASKLNAMRDGSIYLQTITWTVLCYNPVRVLGLMGLAGVGMALLIGLGLIIARLMGNTTLPPWGVASMYLALVSGVSGISIFSLGTTFNYLVTLFQKQPVRRSFLGKPLLKKPLENHFGWAGMAILLLGSIIAAISVILGLTGWEMSRFWLYLLGSAMLILVGVQLIIYWILIRVLSELSQHETMISKELTTI